LLLQPVGQQGVQLALQLVQRRELLVPREVQPVLALQALLQLVQLVRHRIRQR
jgi:hypothetical protein